MNLKYDADQQPDDELKPPFTSPTVSSPISAHGCAAHDGQQEVEKSQLFDVTIATPPTDPEMLEVERRVHAIAHRLIEYLGITGIDPSSYPKVERVTSRGETSHYNGHRNVIGLESEDFTDGFVIGEEVSHWLHAQCLLIRSHITEGSCGLTGISWLNALEVVGYVGRELSRRACADSEFGSFFDPNSEHAPQSVKEFRRLGRERKRELDKKRKALSSLDSEAEALVKACRKSLQAGMQTCEDFAESRQDLNHDSVREIITITCRNAVTPVKEATKKLEGSQCREGFEELGLVDAFRQIQGFLERTSVDLLGKLSDREEPFEHIKENRAEELDSLFRRVLSKWGTQLSEAEHLLLTLSLDLTESAGHLVLIHFSQATHKLGYEAGAIWLERTTDIRGHGARLFYLSPEELYAEYVKPLGMHPIARGMYTVAKSARELFDHLVGRAKLQG